MRKLAGQLGSEMDVEHRRSRWPLAIMALILVVGLGPLVLEGTCLCVGMWKEVLGVAADVRTPVLDGVQDEMHELTDCFWGEVTPFFRSMPWDPKIVVPAASVIMVLAMLLLRR